MARRLSFEKMVASGNDFIILDNYKKRKTFSKKGWSEIVRRLCARKFSVGADGILVIGPSKRADFKMRIFNPDGREVEMCGNGSRCVALYAARKKITASPMSIETRAGFLRASANRTQAKVKFPAPKNIRTNFTLKVGGRNYTANYINTSVPHVVLFFKKINNLDVVNLGRKIRYHAKFKPRGTNADFVKVMDSKNIALRTYERGVEAETLSCGTGAVASAVITALIRSKHKKGNFKIRVHTKSKEILKIHFKVNNKCVGDVFLEGPVKSVYHATIDL